MRRPPGEGRANKRCAEGFTLVELLVVIAVIAMLMAILLPALRKAKQLAQRVACGSNLRQIAYAWNLYLEDNDGYFPDRKTNINQYYGGWLGKKGIGSRILNRHLHLGPNLPSPNEGKVFRCPADRGGVLSRPGVVVYTYIGTSYQTNMFLIGGKGFDARYWYSPTTAEATALVDGINGRLASINRNGVTNASRLLLIGDYSWYNQWNPSPGWMSEEEKRTGEWHGRPDHHCIAFLDGHSAFTEIRKGFWITADYSVLPWKELYPLAKKIQSE